MLAAKVSFRYFGIFLFITIFSFDFYYVIIQDNNIYFNGDGRLIKNTEIIIEGKRYKADENGILTLVDTSKENGWRLAGNNWYYYENGALIKDSFKEIKGVRYHFEKDGKMSTGAFYPDPTSPICYLAEPNGEVVSGKHGWYHSSQTDKWYWFNGADSLILNSLVKDAGKKYYVGIYNQGQVVLEDQLATEERLTELKQEYSDYLIKMYDESIDLTKNLYALAKQEDYVENVDALVPCYIKEVEAKKQCL